MFYQKKLLLFSSDRLTIDWDDATPSANPLGQAAEMFGVEVSLLVWDGTRGLCEIWAPSSKPEYNVLLLSKVPKCSGHTLSGSCCIVF